MRSYLNIIPFIFYAFLMFTSQNSILNLYLKCRINSDFQGSLLCSHLVGSVSNFWLFLRCTWKKITTRVINFLKPLNLKFLKISNFSLPFLKFIDFKITTNSFIYSLVEQFLEIHFHKNNYRGKGYTFGKNLTKFSGLYTPSLGWGGIIYENQSNNNNQLVCSPGEDSCWQIIEARENLWTKDVLHTENKGIAGMLDICVIWDHSNINKNFQKLIVELLISG